MLPILIVYDCVYNNGVITLIFKYLFFYVIYTLWKRISNYLKNTTPLDIMFFELYYKADTVEYTNISEEGEYLIYMYQANDLQYYPENANKDILYIFNFYFFEICIYNRFTSNDGKLFTNSLGHTYIRNINET